MAAHVNFPRPGAGNAGVPNRFCGTSQSSEPTEIEKGRRSLVAGAEAMVIPAPFARLDGTLTHRFGATLIVSLS